MSDERTHKILSEQTLPPRYGHSPAMDILPGLKAFNALPQAERVEAAADFVRRLIAENRF